MNRYTYRDIFSSHKVAAGGASPQAAAQAKKAAEAGKTKKAKEAKAKAEADAKAKAKDEADAKAKAEKADKANLDILVSEIKQINSLSKQIMDLKNFDSSMRKFLNNMDEKIKAIHTLKFQNTTFNNDVNPELTKLNKLYTAAANHINKIEAEQAKAAKAATAKK
jgi:hypothetical protein